MDDALHNELEDLSLGPIRYFDSVGSTNTYAAGWAASGAPDLSLVVADEQTAGKGRLGRSWFTPPGSALAFSLILRGTHLQDRGIGLFAGLGAVAVWETLEQDYGLPAEIKWPNDVIINGAKVCGVLAESAWEGGQIGHIVLGIGINVTPEAVPPREMTRFPAAAVEPTAGRPVDRWVLLRQVLQSLLRRREQVGSRQFIETWQAHLAFRDKQVQVGKTAGRLLGLTTEGHLRLETAEGIRIYSMGEMELGAEETKPAAQ